MKLSTPATLAFSGLLASSNIVAAQMSNLRGDATSTDDTATISRDLQADQDFEGTFVIAHTQYEDLREDDPTWALELDSGEILNLEDVSPAWAIAKGKEMKSGETRVKVTGRKTFNNGQGQAKGLKLKKGKDMVIKQSHGWENAPGQLKKNNKGRKLTRLGSRTIVVVRVNAAGGASTTANLQTLKDSVFGTNGDPVNLKSQFEACSYDKLTFGPPANACDGALVDGAMEVTVTTSPSQGDDAMRNAITSQINNMCGTSNPSTIADHFMYCLPPNTLGGIAYAYINSWNSVYSDEWCTYVSAQLHEVGHNLGLGHSNENGDYRDQTGLMGFSYGYSDYPVMCFNAAKSWQLGWYSDKTVTVAPAPADNGWSGRVYGISDYGSSAATTVLVKIDTTSDTDYYISFNRAAGVNIDTVEAENQVVIQTTAGEGDLNNGYEESELEAKLSESGTFQPSTIPGRGVTVNEINLDASPPYAIITIGTPPSGPTNPPPTNPPPTNPPPTNPPPTNPPPTNPPPTNPPPTNPPPTPTPPSSDSHWVVCGRVGRCTSENKYLASNTEEHEIRCCSDSLPPSLPVGWTFVNRGGSCPYSESPPNCPVGTYSDALNECSAAGARLCTETELEANCARGTGCGFDNDLVWTSTASAPAPTNPPPTNPPPTNPPPTNPPPTNPPPTNPPPTNPPPTNPPPTNPPPTNPPPTNPPPTNPPPTNPPPTNPPPTNPPPTNPPPTNPPPTNPPPTNPPPTPQVSSGFLEIVIVTDQWGSETSWALTDDSNGATLASRNGHSSLTTYTVSGNVPTTWCYRFTILDAYGDGICCDFGNGSYTVTFGGAVVGSGGEFGSSETFTFGNCPAGGAVSTFQDPAELDIPMGTPATNPDGSIMSPAQKLAASGNGPAEKLCFSNGTECDSDEECCSGSCHGNGKCTGAVGNGTKNKWKQNKNKL